MAASAPGAAVAHAVYEACVAEVQALKPGNVSVYAEGHGMGAEDFVRSAGCCAGILGTAGLSVGRRILQSVEATWRSVGCNTNLGIILLAAPLAQAALEPAPVAFGERLRAVLQGLDVEDARLAYEAIRLARPGGLGHSARHDVHAQPAVTLREAMAEAQERDRIARQYVSDYEDVRAVGLPRLEEALGRWRSGQWATVAAYLAFLSRFPDTHVERKHGPETAEQVRRQSAEVEAAFQRGARPEAALDLLLDFDARLKQARINPGTSADLTVATLLWRRLESLQD